MNPKVKYINKPPLGTKINWSHPLSRGLAGCWLFNEGAGTLVRDIAGGRDGTINGGLGSDLIWGPSRDGSSLTSVLNATSNRIILTGPPSGNAWTWDSIIKLNSLTDSWQSIFTQLTTYGIWFRSNGVIWVEYGVDRCISNTELTTGIWYHLVVTNDGSTTRIYINGREDKNSSISSPPSFTVDSMLSDSSSETVDGICEYQRFWLRALTPTEVLRLYTNPYDNFNQSRPFQFAQNAIITSRARRRILIN